tara:strand:- start:323 stop:523 length:201 start_codon:yes stop_codon:yes gene_type:complete
MAEVWRITGDSLLIAGSPKDKLEELQKIIDEVEDAYIIIGDAYEVAYAAVVKAYDDYNDERNRQES